MGKLSFIKDFILIVERLAELKANDDNIIKKLGELTNMITKLETKISREINSLEKQIIILEKDRELIISEAKNAANVAATATTQRLLNNLLERIIHLENGSEAGAGLIKRLDLPSKPDEIQPPSE